MLWMHYLVGLSQAWHRSGVDCVRNANKCPKIPFHDGEENEKVKRNTHADPYHHQNNRQNDNITSALLGEVITAYDKFI